LIEESGMTDGGGANGRGRLQIGLMMRSGDHPVPGAGRVVSWSELKEIAIAAEEVGVDTLFAPDHLIFRKYGSFDSILEGESKGCWEVWTLLSAIASITSRVTLGPFVACTSFREPALLAKMADTLDEVSGGRLLLGLGAGYHVPEYTAFGYPHDHLAGRFEEALQIILPLLKGERVTFHGSYYNVDDCLLVPHGPRPGGPPIWIGARQPRMLRLVAKYADAYNTMAHVGPETVNAQMALLDEACEDVGRDPSTIGKTIGAFVAYPGAEDDPGGVHGNSIVGTPEQVAERLHAMHEVGVEHANLFASPWGLRAVEQTGQMIRHLRALGS
jgi:alkanesulfonate monooxygenase SsuD/methylene tetrahydromethanopterin reductase-like flavin-dependent oxidoreductase (luciferase family)